MTGLGRDTPVLSDAERAALAIWLGVGQERVDAIPADVLAALAARMRVADDAEGREGMVERLTMVVEELLTETRRDHLAEVLSRTGLEEVIALELERARRYTRRLSVILVDVDHLDELNVRHGHAAGDAVLRAIAARMQRGLRSSDRLGRWGGDEFLVVCPEVSRPATHAVAEKLVGLAIAPVDWRGEAVRVTVSVGWAAATAEMTSLDLLQGAEEALERARRGGRGRVSG